MEGNFRLQQLKRQIVRNQCLVREIDAMRVVLSETQLDLLGVRASERQANYQALHDELTALPNRRYFHTRLAAALTAWHLQSAEIAVLFIDLNGFKQINDTHGHSVGDELLSIVGKRLAHAVRAEDFVSRLGGDEYACLIRGAASRDALAHIATTLRQIIAGPIKIGDLTLTVQPAIGIAQYGVDALTADGLLNAADAAMYVAKRQKLDYAFSEVPITLSRASHLTHLP